MTDDMSTEIMAALRELQDGQAEIMARAVLQAGRASLLRMRLDTLTDVMADFRRDLMRHRHGDDGGVILP
jgi:hypothetical protein